MASKKIFLRSVQFQGANGFPMAMYRPVFSQIRSKVLNLLDQKGYHVENVSTFTIGGCDLFQYADVGDDWSAMVDRLEVEVEKRRVGNDALIFIGHSFGKLV